MIRWTYFIMQIPQELDEYIMVKKILPIFSKEILQQASIFD